LFRFVDRNQIYTYCGIVLVAINPYQENIKPSLIFYPAFSLHFILTFSLIAK
jgi:hypothetical protein